MKECEHARIYYNVKTYTVISFTQTLKTLSSSYDQTVAPLNKTCAINPLLWCMISVTNKD